MDDVNFNYYVLFNPVYLKYMFSMKLRQFTVLGVLGFWNPECILHLTARLNPN